MKRYVHPVDAGFSFVCADDVFIRAPFVFVARFINRGAVFHEKISQHTFCLFFSEQHFLIAYGQFHRVGEVPVQGVGIGRFKRRDRFVALSPGSCKGENKKRRNPKKIFYHFIKLLPHANIFSSKQKACQNIYLTLCYVIIFCRMEIILLCAAETDDSEIKNLCTRYEKRLNHYIRFRMEEIRTPKIRGEKKLTEREGELILEKILPSDLFILLDEKGKELTSEQLACQIQKYMNGGVKRVVFSIGGPYGFSEAVRSRADGMLSLSRLTFTHQMVRLFFTEQLYRAFTILRNEPYHH